MIRVQCYILSVASKTRSDDKVHNSSSRTEIKVDSFPLVGSEIYLIMCQLHLSCWSQVYSLVWWLKLITNKVNLDNDTLFFVTHLSGFWHCVRRKLFIQFSFYFCIKDNEGCIIRNRNEYFHTARRMHIPCVCYLEKIFWTIFFFLCTPLIYLCCIVKTKHWWGTQLLFFVHCGKISYKNIYRLEHCFNRPELDNVRHSV